MSDDKKHEHAIANARNWLESIARWYELTHASYDEAEKYAEEELSEPLSVQVRSGWHSLGEKLEASKYEILLTTGGPALRVWGELGEHGEAATAKLQWQDWFTPWTDYYEGMEDQDAVLLAYAGRFYFGE